MNAKSYRVKTTASNLDFPLINGLAESAVTFQSEPILNKDKVLLTITNSFMVYNVDNKSEHEVLSVQSNYEIPTTQINSREDVYAFYNDALFGLDEYYKYLQTQIPPLPSRAFPTQPMENYKLEIDRVFSLLISQN